MGGEGNGKKVGYLVVGFLLGLRHRSGGGDVI